ncbi:hypothetical protein Daus18300_006167 [Diaporthe australafricana]|uniref:Uncharacterized protein n=1 Tax=Diaporthe australafricana TaxID=127596 RepID=A0ABR3WWR7_9PEZI
MTQGIHTNERYAMMHLPTLAGVDTHVSDNDHYNSEHQGRRCVTDRRPSAKPYELEAVPFKALVEPNTVRYQPNVSFHASLEKPRDLGKEHSGQISSGSTSRPKPPKDVKTTLATAIRRRKDSEATETGSSSSSNDMESDSDPFLGTGRRMSLFFSINSATTMTTNSEPQSPSLGRVGGRQLGGSPGLLNLHDAQDEVISLLDELKTTQRKQIKNEVDAALKMCQDDMKVRSKDKNIGTAEANILDREAARIGRARDEASRHVPDSNKRARSPREDAVFEESLRLALTKLIEDARAALEAVAQFKSQPAPASVATRQYTPYPGADHRLVATTQEKPTLNEQMARLYTEQVRNGKKYVELKRKMDEVWASRVSKYDSNQDEPAFNKLPPWGKDWNIDSRRGG